MCRNTEVLPEQGRLGLVEGPRSSSRKHSGVAHGDLSAYNILAAGERLVIIDLPQVIDLIANPNGPELLLRDCRNVCSWFRARGLDVDARVLFDEVKPV